MGLLMTHRSILLITLLALFALGSVRLWGLVLHNPMIAFANNYDMVRAQYCLGWWPVGETTALGAHPDQPHRWYRGEARNWRDCYYSSALIPLQLGAWVAQVHRSVVGDVYLSLQWVGITQAMLLMLLSAAITYGLWRYHKIAALIHTLIYAVILTDPLNTLYASSWYYEFPMLLYLYVFGGWMVFLAVRFRVTVQKPKAWEALVAGLCLFLLGTSKIQSMPLVLLLALLLPALMRGYRWGKGWWLLVALFACASLPAQKMNQTSGILETAIYGNLTNVVNTVLLAEVSEPLQVTRSLGLPDRCAAYGGISWHKLDMTNGHPCPEIASLSHARIVLEFLKHPEIWWDSYQTFLLKGTLWNHRRLGHVEGQPDTQIHTLDAPLLWSIANPMRELSLAVYFFPWLVALLMWCILPFIAYREWKRTGQIQDSTSLLLVVLTLLHAVLFVSLMGDGYVDVAKHNYFANQLLVLFYLLWPWWLWSSNRRRVES